MNSEVMPSTTYLVCESIELCSKIQEYMHFKNSCMPSLYKLAMSNMCNNNRTFDALSEAQSFFEKKLSDITLAGEFEYDEQTPNGTIYTRAIFLVELEQEKENILKHFITKTLIYK